MEGRPHPVVPGDYRCFSTSRVVAAQKGNDQYASIPHNAFLAHWLPFSGTFNLK